MCEIGKYYFIEAACEKYRKEAEEKEEMLHIKTDEIYHKSMNDDLVKRGKMRKCLNIKAINEAEVQKGGYRFEQGGTNLQ